MSLRVLEGGRTRRHPGAGRLLAGALIFGVLGWLVFMGAVLGLYLLLSAVWP